MDREQMKKILLQKRNKQRTQASGHSQPTPMEAKQKDQEDKLLPSSLNQQQSCLPNQSEEPNCQWNNNEEEDGRASRRKLLIQKLKEKQREREIQASETQVQPQERRQGQKQEQGQGEEKQSRNPHNESQHKQAQQQMEANSMKERQKEDKKQKIRQNLMRLQREKEAQHQENVEQPFPTSKIHKGVQSAGVNQEQKGEKENEKEKEKEGQKKEGQEQGEKREKQTKMGEVLVKRQQCEPLSQIRQSEASIISPISHAHQQVEGQGQQILIREQLQEEVQEELQEREQSEGQKAEKGSNFKEGKEMGKGGDKKRRKMEKLMLKEVYKLKHRIEELGLVLSDSFTGGYEEVQSGTRDYEGLEERIKMLENLVDQIGGVHK